MDDAAVIEFLTRLLAARDPAERQVLVHSPEAVAAGERAASLLGAQSLSLLRSSRLT